MGKTRTEIQGFLICFLIASVAFSYVVEFDDDVKLTADESLLWFYNGNYYVNFGASGSLAGNYSFLWPVNDGDSGQYLKTDGSGVLSWDTPVISSFDSITMIAQSSNPDTPANGESVIWLSDGTGYGDAGDVMIASTVSGTTRYGTLFDFSSGTLWTPDNVLLETGDILLLETGDKMLLE